MGRHGVVMGITGGSDGVPRNLTRSRGFSPGKALGFPRVISGPHGVPWELQVDQLGYRKVPRDTMRSPGESIAPAGNHGTPSDFSGDLVVSPSSSAST